MANGEDKQPKGVGDKIKDRPTKPKRQKQIENLSGFFSVTSSEPSYTPENFAEQIVIYKSGSTRRLYWYDNDNDEWVYAGGTAV